MASRKKAKPRTAKKSPSKRPAASRRSEPARKPAAAPPAKPAARLKIPSARLREIRRLLEDERTRLQQALRAQTDSGEILDTGAVGDVIDAATNASSQYLAFGLSATEAKNLKEVEEALARLAAGEYGLCRRCLQEIEKERLEAIPWAPTCIACRREEERLESASVPRVRTPITDFPES